MFYDNYKDLFLNDNTDPYANQVTKARKISMTKPRKNDNLFALNAKRVIKNNNEYGSRNYSNRKQNLPNIQFSKQTKPFGNGNSQGYKFGSDYNISPRKNSARKQHYDNQPSYITKIRDNSTVKDKTVEQGTSEKLMEAFKWQDNSANKYKYARVRSNYQMNRPKSMLANLHREDKQVDRRENTVKESPRLGRYSHNPYPETEAPEINKVEKNRISYNFFTGEDYNKKEEPERVYINRSEGVIDMFNAFKDVKQKEEYKQPEDENERSKKQIDQFHRGLVDARKLLISKEDAMKMQDIARKVFPENRYEDFMRKNLNNPKRIENFKKAIDRRIQNKFRIQEKRDKLKRLLEQDKRRGSI